jgi:hypothetical protein
MITNLNVILYLSTFHTIYLSVPILFMIMPSLIINTYKEQESNLILPEHDDDDDDELIILMLI